MKTTSVILTIYNKDFLIQRVAKSILENSSDQVKEIIVVFDGCEDLSETYTKEIFNSQNKLSVKYNYADNLFETKCNNIALKQSSCDYSMIIQDDMIIQEKDFDKRMIKPFMFTDVLCVTSRMAHNDLILPNGAIAWTDKAGKDTFTRRDLFYIRDIANRGPLLVDNKKLQTLNYLDEIYSPQNLDDHDLCFRAWKEHGWVAGSYWIEYESRYEWGGSRGKNAEWLEEKYRNNLQTLASRHADYMEANMKHNQERLIL